MAHSNIRSQAGKHLSFDTKVISRHTGYLINAEGKEIRAYSFIKRLSSTFSRSSPSEDLTLQNVCHKVIMSYDMSLKAKVI